MIVPFANTVFNQPLSPKENFVKAEAEIRSVAAQGSQFVVLPEYHLTSWVPEHPDFVASCVESMEYLPRYQALARELNINIVPGTIVELVKQEQSVLVNDGKDSPSSPVIELHNMSYFIAASTGDILSTYQKKNLWHLERGTLTAGLHTPHRAFDVPLSQDRTLRVGMLICWDLAFPEAFRGLVADGAQLIIVPAYWHITQMEPKVLALNPKSEVEFLDSVMVTRAYENTCAVALCNAWGQSQVTMPILGSLGKLGVEEEGTIVSEIDLSVLGVAENHYMIRADLAREGWHYSH